MASNQINAKDEHRIWHDIAEQCTPSLPFFLTHRTQPPLLCIPRFISHNLNFTYNANITFSLHSLPFPDSTCEYFYQGFQFCCQFLLILLSNLCLFFLFDSRFKIPRGVAFVTDNCKIHACMCVCSESHYGNCDLM